MDRHQQTIGNMLKDAGYTTCYSGKWQLDGGDQSIHAFGFDKYSVWLPYKVCPEVSNGPRYKGPRIYQGGSFFPDSIMKDKYSEDINFNYLMKFIDSNKTKPFFAYYSMMLCHAAYCPTPDDPEYKAWPLDAYRSEPKFFPSMVKYMDKKIGELLDSLKSMGIEKNTIIFFIGDNGTQVEITSLFNNYNITGAKGKTIEYGIHVPLLCKWPGKIAAGSTNNDLVDFTDILPTLADVADIPTPGNYGPLDGVSFYPQLKGLTGTPRSSIFTYYNQQACVGDYRIWRYSQDSTYKLYDTGDFYQFSRDPFEQKPLPDSVLTGEQKQIKQNLQSVLNRMHG
jgi:arylsulfatase A